MTLRPQNAMATRERRTQGAQIAALFARPRTCYRAGKRVLGAVASFFNGLLALSFYQTVVTVAAAVHDRSLVRLGVGEHIEVVTH
jgi:hypothetical protein